MDADCYPTFYKEYLNKIAFVLNSTLFLFLSCFALKIRLLARDKTRGGGAGRDEESKGGLASVGSLPRYSTVKDEAN